MKVKTEYICTGSPLVRQPLSVFSAESHKPDKFSMTEKLDF
jgi:hypothetical protein